MPRDLVRRESQHLYAEPPASPFVEDVLHTILDLVRVTELEVEHARAASGLGHNEFLALRFLLQAQREGRFASPSELAIMLDVTTASVTKIVDHLEEKGDVRRLPHGTDRRVRLLMPTAAGEAKIRASYGAFHQAVSDAVGSAGVADLRGLERVAKDIIERIQRDWPAEPAPPR
ncbi:MAG: hypothetical protein DI534_04365 [Leifsonia xyli]|nr:MAG: hypothetical protein DI534_04365 [Leifsonia xyli]